MLDKKEIEWLINLLVVFKSDRKCASPESVKFVDDVSAELIQLHADCVKQELLLNKC